MNKRWEAEFQVGQSLAEHLIASQFPGLRPWTVKPFAEGWDNTAFLVNEEAVFRFPRRQMGADCMANEIRVLPQLTDRLPLPITSPTWIGTPDDVYPWPFAGYRMLPGITACRANLNDCEREQLAEPLAEFLVALHAIDTTSWPPENKPRPDAIGRLCFAKRKPLTQDQLAGLRAKKLLSDKHVESLLKMLDEIVREFGAEFDPTNEPPLSILHGDLYVRHLLVDERLGTRLTGVIDWGDVYLGHVANDLMIAQAFLPRSADDRFSRIYGGIDEATRQLARFRVMNHASIVALYANDIGDADLLREGLRALHGLI